MIEHLRVSRAAHFYKRKKRLSGAAVNRLFKTGPMQLRRRRTRLALHRVESGPSTHSAICFSF